jgi:hypothetical protein
MPMLAPFKTVNRLLCRKFEEETIPTGGYRGVEVSFSKTTGNKTLEFGGVSPSYNLTRYKMKSFYFYLI